MQTGIVYNIQRMSTQDGPGLRTTVFLKGCPLHCQWCSNPESQHMKPQLMVFSRSCTGCGACVDTCPQKGIYLDENGVSRTHRELCINCGMCAEACPNKARELSGKEMSTAEVMQIIKKDELFYRNSDGGVTFCGGEPTASGGFLLELMDACNVEGYHVCLDTCGFCSPNMFEAAAQKADLLLFDCKHMDTSKHRELTGVDNTLILENLRRVFELSIPVRIRVPLMPGLNDTEENIAALAYFLKPYGKTEVDVLPCHTFGSTKYAALDFTQPPQVPYDPETLNRVRTLFAEHGIQTELVE